MDTLNKIYNCYRTTKTEQPRIIGKFKQLDNIIKVNLERTPIHDKDFLIHLLTDLIEFCKVNDCYDFMEEIRTELSKILRILRITNVGKNGVCVCGAKPVNMTRHLTTKKHKKFVEANTDEENPEKQHLTLIYTPFKYSVKVFKENTNIPRYDKMDKVQIWDNTASTSWEFGIHEGKIYNRNKIECGIYRYYMDDKVPNEFKNDKGIIIDRLDRRITEYILNENGMLYSLFSKNIFKAFYYDLKKEMLIRSEDDILLC